MTAFADTMNPPSRLNPPADYGSQVKKDIDNALGMIHYVVEIIDQIIGQNLEQELTSWVGGNYGQLLSIRDCWNNAGWAIDDINTNLTAGLSTLYGQSSGAMTDPHWNGNAAGAFYNHMIGWSAALSQDRDACFTVRDKISDLAEAAKEALTTILQAIKTIVSLISGVSTSIEIPVWGEYEAAKAVWEAIKLINNVRKVVSAFINTVKLAVDFCHDIVDIVHATNPTIRVNLPGAYTAPTSPAA